MFIVHISYTFRVTDNKSKLANEMLHSSLYETSSVSVYRIYAHLFIQMLIVSCCLVSSVL